MSEPNFQIVALLDKPSPKSYGMVPIVVMHAGRIRVSGLASTSRFRGEEVRQEEIDLLIDQGHALAADAKIQTLEDDFVALWIGRDFHRDAVLLGTPPRNPPVDPTGIVQDGAFYVEYSKDAYSRLESWTRCAFEVFSVINKCDERRAGIAQLMRWTLPSHELTREVTMSCAKARSDL